MSIVHNWSRRAASKKIGKHRQREQLEKLKNAILHYCYYCSRVSPAYVLVLVLFGITCYYYWYHSSCYYNDCLLLLLLVLLSFLLLRLLVVVLLLFAFSRLLPV